MELFDKFVMLCIMNTTGKEILVKYKKKNIGNSNLIKEIDYLLDEFTNKNWADINQLKLDLKDADRVHSDGFYVINVLKKDRLLVLIEFGNPGDVTFVWVGNHQEYEATFKNNKDTIETWLRNKGYVE